MVGHICIRDSFGFGSHVKVVLLFAQTYELRIRSRIWAIVGVLLEIPCASRFL